MKRLIFLIGAAMVSLSQPAVAEQRIVCTMAVEMGSDEPLVREGNCDEPMSPASTFKIAISLMGFDAGILADKDHPEWPFREGYADWNPIWRQATTPETWLRDSVVWFSQQVTERLGEERFADYVARFDYGNRDVSGDAGKGNGLTNAWLSSSLQIAPAEQVAFLTRMLDGELPVSDDAVAHTVEILDQGVRSGGWRVYGKTGAGLPRGDDGALLRGQPFGWYVGWATRDDRTIVFARLVRFSERPEGSPGWFARDGVVDDLFGPDGAID
jgi:beta-lactamase class D